MRASHVTTLVLSLTHVASAFPWPRWFPEIDSLVVRRQDTDSSDTAEATTTATSAAEATSTSSSDAADATNGNTAKPTSTSGDDSATTTASGDSDATSTSDSDSDSDSNANSTATANSPGSAVMKYPVTTLTSALYMIGDFVTFSWNYTQLTATPTAVNVIASASTSSLGASTWTLTQNMTFQTDAAFTWDTGAYQTAMLQAQKPLLVEMYTLYIYDAESSAVTETAGYGSLTANAALTFGMYTGQPYTSLATGFTCATCSGAMSAQERQAVGLLFAMFGVTVASFTWFVTGLW